MLSKQSVLPERVHISAYQGPMVLEIQGPMVLETQRLLVLEFQNPKIVHPHSSKEQWVAGQ